MNKDKLLLYTTLIFFVIGGYVIFSCRTYQFNHPEMTDTQRYLHIVDALTWKK